MTFFVLVQFFKNILPFQRHLTYICSVAIPHVCQSASHHVVG